MSLSTKRKRTKISQNRLRRVLFSLTVIIAFIFATWVVWTDHVVTRLFDGKKWSLPSRVYARPLELYEGKQLSIADFTQELALLGYAKVNSLSHTHQYQILGQDILLTTKAFKFWDGEEDSKQLIISFQNDKIQKILRLPDNKRVSIFRLEPLLIGKIYPKQKEDRLLVKLDEVPPLLIKTLIAVEDKSFFTHHGIDIKAILRAIFADLKSLSLKQGGSTLTQQLVKNFYLDQGRTLKRKIQELLMAIILDYRYNKSEILEAYINEIYLGQNGNYAIHGFGLAAEYYFGTSLRDLKPHQIALLVGMLKGASYYNPWRNPQRSLDRRNIVLTLMSEQKLISTVERNRYQNAGLDIKSATNSSGSRFSAFLDLVRTQLRQDYDEDDLRGEGFRIFTTVDPLLQIKIEKVAASSLNQIEKKHRLPLGELETAIIISNTKSSEIQAIIGGRNNQLLGFNRAMNAKRQIGSLIKPVIYLAALSQPKKYNLATLIDDSQIRIKDKSGTIWSPQNYDRRYHGRVSLQTALAKSYNAATVNLGLQLGFASVTNLLLKLGGPVQLVEYPSSFLGTMELTPLQTSQVYQTLSTGFYSQLRAIRAVTTKDNFLLQRYGVTVNQVLSKELTFLAHYSLSKVVEEGTAQGLKTVMRTKLPLAGKTGTTNNLKDSWFAGFSENYLATVWVGRDDNKTTHLTGASGAMNIWASVMKEIPVQPLALKANHNISWVRINPRTGNRVEQACNIGKLFPIISGYQPKVYDECPNINSLSIP